jgi:hypothetical protein
VIKVVVFVQRATRKKELDAMLAITKSPKARQDLRTRPHCMERSYARSTRYGFDQARWRGLWKVAIQEYLVCAIQNIETLIRHIERPVKAVLCLTPIHAEALGLQTNGGLFHLKDSLGRFFFAI